MELPEHVMRSHVRDLCSVAAFLAGIARVSNQRELPHAREMPKTDKKKADDVSVNSVIQELNNADNVFKESVGSGLGEEEVLESLFTSVSSMLDKCGMTTGEEKVQIGAAVRKGPWNEEQKKQLARAIISSNAARADNTKHA